MSIRDNILKIKEEIGDEAKLVAVSKTRSTKEKQKLLPDDIERHMIGHLQKNKVKYISSFISLIHSLDRISLAKEIDKYAKKSNRKIDCLIQLKISSEETKFGLDISHLEDFFSEVKKYNNINLVGLMGMASFTQEKEKIIDEFNKIKELYD